MFGGAAGEEETDGGKEGGIDEGMGKRRGRVLAICPVVRAPSGQGEKLAPWLTKHMHTHIYAHVHAGHCAHSHKHTQIHIHKDAHTCAHTIGTLPGYIVI